jgi:hypothetical protein
MLQRGSQQWISPRTHGSTNGGPWEPRRRAASTLAAVFAATPREARAGQDWSPLKGHRAEVFGANGAKETGVPSFVGASTVILGADDGRVVQLDLGDVREIRELGLAPTPPPPAPAAVVPSPDPATGPTQRVPSEHARAAPELAQAAADTPTLSECRASDFGTRTVWKSIGAALLGGGGVTLVHAQGPSLRGVLLVWARSSQRC